MRLFWIMIVLALAGCSTFKPSGVRPVLNKTEWVSHDGKTMPWQSWAVPAGTKPRGVVIAVHGLSGAKSDFWYLGQELPNAATPSMPTICAGRATTP
jgi:acylglycerol lipase